MAETTLVCDGSPYPPNTREEIAYAFSVVSRNRKLFLLKVHQSNDDCDEALRAVNELGVIDGHEE